MNVGSWGLWEIPLRTDSWLIFAVVLIALIVFIWLIARLVTRATEDSDPAEIDRQMLTAINDLHRKGDLSQEEFRSIKGQLIERLNEHRTSADAAASDKHDHAASIGSTVAASISPAIEIDDDTTSAANGSKSVTTTEAANSDEQLKDTKQ